MCDLNRAGCELADAIDDVELALDVAEAISSG
eukprot:SAG31_NODE_40308_length_281_cov_1.137363_1_plen_31_part_10